MTSKHEESYDNLSRQQLEIYARELSEHFNEERKLRQQLEERGKELEKRVREVTALNNMFQKHLSERFALIQAYKDMLEHMQTLSVQVEGMVKKARSQPIPDLSDIAGMGGENRKV